MTAGTVSTTGSVKWGGLLTTGLIAGVVAAVLNSIVFVIGQAAGVDFVIVGGPEGTPPAPLAIPAIVIFSLVPALIAPLIVGALVRFTSQGVRIFQIIAVIFLIVSFIPDIAMPAPTTTATKGLLMLMHVIAAAIITYIVSRKAAE